MNPVRKLVKILFHQASNAIIKDLFRSKGLVSNFLTG